MRSETKLLFSNSEHFFVFQLWTMTAISQTTLPIILASRQVAISLLLSCVKAILLILRISFFSVILFLRIWEQTSNSILRRTSAFLVCYFASLNSLTFFLIVSLQHWQMGQQAQQTQQEQSKCAFSFPSNFRFDQLVTFLLNQVINFTLFRVFCSCSSLISLNFFLI